MKSHFLTDLHISLNPDSGEGVWILDAPLTFYSSRMHRRVIVPVDFQTDLASVPRIPFVFWFWGGRAHREGVLHDYLYRIDSDPTVGFSIANLVFLDAMKARGKPSRVCYAMYAGVVIGGYPSYHKRKVSALL